MNGTATRGQGVGFPPRVVAHVLRGEIPVSKMPAALSAGQKGVVSMTKKFRVFGIAAAMLAASVSGALAAEKVTFMTNWLAQAEHGGYYQAVADGTYAAW